MSTTLLGHWRQRARESEQDVRDLRELHDYWRERALRAEQEARDLTETQTEVMDEIGFLRMENARLKRAHASVVMENEDFRTGRRSRP